MCKAYSKTYINSVMHVRYAFGYIFSNSLVSSAFKKYLQSIWILRTYPSHYNTHICRMLSHEANLYPAAKKSWFWLSLHLEDQKNCEPHFLPLWGGNQEYRGLSEQTWASTYSKFRDNHRKEKKIAQQKQNYNFN